MRADPIGRLHRTLPGDSLVLRDAAAVKVRKAGKIASAGPNAPLLMRIVRTPYALPPGRPSRIDVMPPVERVERVNTAAERALATAERAFDPSRSPAGRRPHAFAVRPSRFALLPAELPPVDLLDDGESDPA